MGGMLTNEVFLDNVRVSKDNIVGQENRGFYHAMQTLEFERSNTAEPAARRRELQEFIQFCKEETRNGKPLIKDPKVRAKLAKMALDLLMTKRKEKDPFEDLPQNPQELEKSRQKIQKRYSLLASRHGFTPTFDDVVHFVFTENYHHNEADFYTDLIKMGMPERVIFKHYQLFGDIWNYFPHKRLKGKSPVELFRDKHNNI